MTTELIRMIALADALHEFRTVRVYTEIRGAVARKVIDAWHALGCPLAGVDAEEHYAAFRARLRLVTFDERDLDAVQALATASAVRCAEAILQWIAEWSAKGEAPQDTGQTVLAIGGPDTEQPPPPAPGFVQCEERLDLFEDDFVPRCGLTKGHTGPHCAEEDTERCEACGKREDRDLMRSYPDPDGLFFCRPCDEKEPEDEPAVSRQPFPVAAIAAQQVGRPW